MTEKKRNYGIDLLRMLSMFMIVNLHVLGQGGAMVRIVGDEAGYYAAWFLETCAYCAVDCYGLISGYVGVNGKFRPARLLELWLQVFFYSSALRCCTDVRAGTAERRVFLEGGFSREQ